MIARIIRWSARNVVLVSIATVFVTLLGLYAVQKVPLDAIPDLSDVQVIVCTEYDVGHQKGNGTCKTPLLPQIVAPRGVGCLKLHSNVPMRSPGNLRSAPTC